MWCPSTVGEGREGALQAVEVSISLWENLLILFIYARLFARLMVASALDAFIATIWKPAA